jgi:hypothetical protein
MRSLLNFFAFQIGWFSAVLGAGHGMLWVGLAVISGVLLFNLIIAADWKHELALATGAACTGFAVDTALTAADVFTPVPFLMPPPFSPLWMVALWVNQATTLNSCLVWLRGRYFAGALFGAIGGPLAYLGGAKLGAASIPSNHGLLILGIVWAGALPGLFALNEWLSRWLSEKKS